MSFTNAQSEFVTDEALSHLKTYKYQSVDKSYISHYILQHYWNACVKLLPMWLAPNMVTLIGFFFIIGNVILLVAYVPDLVGPAPSWVYLSFAAGLWMYSTMDNIDGKQARRTGTSSGLGELFDHGIDSLNCTLASLFETAALALGTSHAGILTAVIPCLPMFFSTWETYHTHTLYLGYCNGPTEGLIIGCLMMAASGVWGPQIWSQRIADLMGYDWLFGDLALTDIWIVILLSSVFVAHVPFCVWNVVQARKKNGLPVLPVFLEWIPMAVFSFATAAWLYSPYSTIATDNHLVLFCLTISPVFGRMTTKIILAHLTKQPFPMWTVMLLPLIGGAVLANLPRFGFAPITAEQELLYLRSYLGFAVIAYTRWAFLVTGRICNYLGINCLTIADKPAPGQKANGKPLTNGASKKTA